MIVEIYGHQYLLMPDQQLRKNFKLKELANNEGDILKPQFIINEDVDLFLDMLQEMRNAVGSMSISSGYRQIAYNSKVNGDPKSAHIHACAVDWVKKNQTDADRARVKDKWNQICANHKVVGAINFYSGGYHLEAFSNKWYGSTRFATRDYRGKSGDW